MTEWEEPGRVNTELWMTSHEVPLLLLLSIYQPASGCIAHILVVSPTTSYIVHIRLLVL